MDEVTLSEITSGDNDSFLWQILDALPSTAHILKIDPSGTGVPVWANKTYEKIIGMSLSKRSESTWSDFYFPEDMENVREIIKYTYVDKHYVGSVIFRIRKNRNDIRWIKVYAKRIVYNGDDNHLLCVGIDITNELAFNHGKAKEYFKEVNRHKSHATLSQLTATEYMVTQMLAMGKTIKQIAALRNRSDETINNHKRNIFKKLGFNKLSELVAFAIENGLV